MTMDRALIAMPRVHMAPEEQSPGMAYDVPENPPTEITASEESSTLSGLRLVFSNEQLPPRPEPIGQVDTSSGTLDIMSFYDGDPGYEELMDKVVEGRRIWYTARNLLTENASDDTIRGANVEVFALTTPEEIDPVVSLRKFHPETPKNVWELPSFVKFAEAGSLSHEGLLKLEQAISRNDSVVEVCTLWKNDAYGPDAVLASYRPPIQDSIKRKELQVMGVVPAELRGLRKLFGDTIQTLGDPISIKEEGATKKAIIYPVLFEPYRAVGAWLAEVRDAKASGDNEGRAREAIMWTIIKGLSWDYLPVETSTALREVLYENASHAA